MSRQRSSAMLVALVAAAILAGCGGQGDQRPNVLILTLDTTRADHLGCYGSETAQTPRLDAFAAEQAVLFEYPISPVPITLPSHASIFTGTYPAFHGVHDNDGFYVDDELTTLAEILKAEGYATGAVIGAFPVDSQFNLDQGFDTYNDDYDEDWSPGEIEARTPLSFGFIERTADRVNLAAFRWLEDHGDKPFLLWMHYFDPHQPYAPPAPYGSMFTIGYDGEIAFVDECFGAVLDHLETKGLLESTVIVVVGDHGESLEEHGEPTHASFIYDATQRVPLLIAAPGEGFARGGRVRSQVRTIDIAPTILDLLDLPVHPDMQGTTLVPSLEDPSISLELPSMLESHFSQYHFKWAPLRGLRTDKWKYILAPRAELYDLEEDPGELFNIASQRPEITAEMDRQLAELAHRVSSTVVDRSASTSIDPETRAKLEALGYLGGGGAADRLKDFPSHDELAKMPNPLDGVIALHYVNACSEMLRTQNFVDALGIARRGVAADPENYRLQYLLGQAQLGLGNPDKAIAEFHRAARINPSDAATHSMIGRIHYMLGRFDEAREALETAAELEPNQIEVLETLGMAYARLGDLDRAMERLQLAINLDDGSWRTVLRLGRVQADSGLLEEARASFQLAMTLNPYSPEVLGTIGFFYLQTGNPEFGRISLEQAYRVAPNDPAINFYLAEALLQTNADQALVRDLLERVEALAPDSPLAAKAQGTLEKMSVALP